jgi:hypothetical protein
VSLRGLVALDGGRPGADLDGDAARLALLGLGDADLEHAVLEARADGLGLDALGEGQRAPERAVRALDADVALALVLVLGLALAGDGEDVVLDVDVNVVLGEPGRSALSTNWSSVSTRSIAGTQRRGVAPLAPDVVSKKVLNSRFMSFCSEDSSRTGSQRTSAMSDAS